ncbi:MAG: oxidoreductase, partial [Chloroflexia bacterium]
RVSGLDPRRREIAVETEEGVRSIDYDLLVYALGSLTGRDAVPGVREYAYTLAPEGPLSALALRERL